MRKPAAVWCVQIYLAWVALGAGLLAILAPVGLINGGLSIAQAGGTLLLGGVVVSAIAMLLIKMSRQAIRRRSIVLCLWGMVALYPTMNALRQAGYYFPHSTIADDQLAGAAVAEIVRYLVPMALIVWLSLSRRAGEYVSASVSLCSNNDVRLD
ncbi:MAG TPA: hypothetical protein VH814_11995 [Steroidobacteraceae bacterium]|jgi:hypothetical protein